MIGLEVRITDHGVAAELGRDIDKLEQELAARIVEAARMLTDTSIPAGRLYRRGRFTRRSFIGGIRASGTGTRIHRASAPGQPPAKDTGRTYRDITVRRMASGRYRIRFGGSAGFLEFGTRNMRPRPYIVPAIEIAVKQVFGGE